MKMICEVPDEVIKCIKDGTWCGSSVAEKMIANGIPLSSSEEPCEDAISRKAVIQHICESKDCYKENCKGVLFNRCMDISWVNDELPSVNPLPKALTKEERALLQRWRDGRGISLAEFAEALDALQKPKSECEHDHEILKAHSDGANEVLAIIRAEIAKEAKCTMNDNRAGGLYKALQIIDRYTKDGE